MEDKKKTIDILTGSNINPDDSKAMELQRLIACYQLASSDDRNVVWAALNKYASRLKP